MKIRKKDAFCYITGKCSSVKHMEHIARRNIMVGFIIVSHGNLGKALVESAALIVGIQNDIATISISCLSQNVALARKNIISAIDAANDGDGVIIFTDLFGGTPCNLAISTLNIKNVEIVAGVNLPMILKAITLDSSKKYTLREVAEIAKDAGQKQISVISDLA